MGSPAFGNATEVEPDIGWQANCVTFFIVGNHRKRMNFCPQANVAEAARNFVKGTVISGYFHRLQDGGGDQALCFLVGNQRSLEHIP